MTVIQKFPLDFGADSVPPQVFAKQGDIAARTLEITPLDRGKPLPLDAAVTARLRMTKPDGHTVLADAQIADGKITLPLPGQALTASGKAAAEIGLYKDETLLSSQVFFLNIRRAAYSEDAAVSSDEFGSLTKALASVEDATAASQSAKTAAEKAEAAAKAAQTDAEAAKTAASAAQEDAESAEAAARTSTEAAESAAAGIAAATAAATSAEEAAEKAQTAAEAAKTAAVGAFRLYDGYSSDFNADEKTAPGVYFIGSTSSVTGLPTEGGLGTLVVFSSGNAPEWTVQLYFYWPTGSFYYRIFDPVHGTKSWQQIK